MSPIAQPITRLSAAFAAVEDRPDEPVRGVVEGDVVLDRVGALDDFVIAVEHVVDAEFAVIDGFFDRGLDLAAGLLSLENERRIIDLGARIGEGIEHRVGQHLKVRQALLGGQQFLAVLARIGGESVRPAFTRSTLAWIMLVE